MPSNIVLAAAFRGLLNWMRDETLIKLAYRVAIEKTPDLEVPKTFNEKLQWLKLHDRNPLYTTLVDKYSVKKWVAERIGSEYVTETYAVWERVEDVDVSGLPKRFVLKTNHDCGGVVVCRDRASFDLGAARRKLARHLRANYYWGGREWPYKDVRPLIFAEECLEPDADGDLPDYKLYRFSNGRVVTLVCEGRASGEGMRKTYFDEGWEPLPLSEGRHPTDPGRPAPARFEEMKELASRIADGLPFVRVDFYESAGRLRFGEVTLYPNSGFGRFDPPEWDGEFGSWVDLSLAYGEGGK